MKNYLIVILFLAGCAHQKIMQYDMPYVSVDNKVERQFEITLTNNINSTICLTPEMWPNGHGVIMLAKDYVFLVVGNHKFPMDDYDGGYCPKCAKLVKSKEKISATIPYDLFKLPETLFNEEKHLEFSPKAFKCADKK